jgi:tetratricopeptide (TPR) repeat protein
MNTTALSYSQLLHEITGFLEAREPARAKELCEQLLKHIKDQPQLWHCYGIALREVGAVEASLIPLHRAVGLAPQLAGAWLNLALSEILLARYEAAEQSLEQVLKLLPNHTTAQFHMATVYHRQKRYTLARELYEVVLLREPNNFNVLLNLALLIEDTGDVQAALSLCKRAQRLFPENSELKQAIARMDAQAQR